jgi:hypothetical protein
MPTALQTPIRQGQAEKVGKRLYRKQLLPVGSVEHEGKELKFSKEYLTKLAANFNAGKMDQVPFILVNERNEHTQDPEKVRGDVTAMEVYDDGLYALAELTERGEQLVKDNPKLGVSARINQDDMVIEHMAGTVNPVAKGMKAWEAINLSNDDVTLLDLSDGEFKVASESADSNDGVPKDSLKPEQLKRLAALADRLKDKDVSDRDTLTDEDIAKLLGSEEETEEPEPVAALSKEAQEKIDLAQKDAREAKAKADAAADRQAEAEWKLTEQKYLNDGVPPSILKLAKPHLSKASSVVELSNADSQACGVARWDVPTTRATVQGPAVGDGNELVVARNCVIPVVASGAVTVGAKLVCAANGAVSAAGATPDARTVIGEAFEAAADTATFLAYIY